MSSMTIRKATLDDREAVLCIHDNVYDGLDYLADYYDDFVSCPYTTPYIGVIDNQIVAFLAAFIVDEGDTVISRAGRMSPRASGKGLFGQLTAHTLQASGVSKHAFITSNTNPFVNKESFRSVNKLILMKHMLRFHFDARALHIPDDVDTDLYSVTDADLMLYFSNSDIRHYLFPSDRLIVDWVPYRLTEANIPLIKWSGKRLKVISNVCFQNGRQMKGLLSYSTIISVKNPPFFCNLFIYGTDVTSLKDHVMAHIRHLRDVTDDVTCVLVMVDEDCDVEALNEIFGDMDVKQDEWRDTEQNGKLITHQYLFEKVLES